MISPLDLAAVFDASPNPYMVLDRDLRYVAANPACLAATHRRREDLIGRRVTDVFPHDPSEPNNESARQLRDSLERVLRAGEPDALPLIHLRSGLSLVRHVVQVHGGSVRAHSEGAGRGATFTVRLPLWAGDAAAEALPLWAPGARLEGMRVLVVDDEEDTREFVRALLQERGARVSVAASAAEALRALQRERPDVPLSDVGMPGEDGYGLLRRVRGEQPGQ